MLGPPVLSARGPIQLRHLAFWLSGLALLIAAGVLLRLITRPLAGEDESLLLHVVAIRTSPLTTLAHGLSLLGRSPAVVVCALVFDLAWSRVRRPSALRPVALVSVVSAVVIQNAVKVLVGRPRPSDALHLEHVTSSSFPSGHATEITALVIVVIVRLWPVSCRPAVRALIVSCGAALVVGVSLSRLYLGVHYPSDVACGVVLGGGCATLAGWLGRQPR